MIEGEITANIKLSIHAACDYDSGGLLDTLQKHVLQELRKSYFGAVWNVEAVELTFELMKQGADNGCTQKEVIQKG